MDDIPADTVTSRVLQEMLQWDVPELVRQAHTYQSHIDVSVSCIKEWEIKINKERRRMVQLIKVRDAVHKLLKEKL